MRRAAVLVYGIIVHLFVMLYLKFLSRFNIAVLHWRCSNVLFDRKQRKEAWCSAAGLHVSSERRAEMFVPVISLLSQPLSVCSMMTHTCTHTHWYGNMCLMSDTGQKLFFVFFQLTGSSRC